MKNKKTVFIFVILGLVVAGAFFLLNSEKDILEEDIQETTQETAEQENKEETPVSIQDEPPTQTTTMPGTQLYRNEEWGFEFEYPEDFVIRENALGYSPFGKFDLVGAPAEKEYLIYRPNPPFLINIATPDFADGAVISRQNFGAIESDVIVGNVHGIKYEYTAELFQKIAVDIPFGEFRMILASNKGYEDIFNLILSTFKFID